MIGKKKVNCLSAFVKALIYWTSIFNWLFFSFLIVFEKFYNRWHAAWSIRLMEGLPIILIRIVCCHRLRCYWTRLNHISYIIYFGILQILCFLFLFFTLLGSLKMSGKNEVFNEKYFLSCFYIYFLLITKNLVILILFYWIFFFLWWLLSSTKIYFWNSKKSFVNW